jgi:Spy/CpxP family protein refolding chaperone
MQRTPGSFTLIALIVLTLAVTACALQAPSMPYAGQEARDIKALAPDEIRALRDGKGMGLAKAAELNGFAGPAHVLELAPRLQLTPEQQMRTEALFASMDLQAKAAGEALIAKERELDRLFAARTITADSLDRVLRGNRRAAGAGTHAHLQAHLAQVAILTPEQNMRYAELRGYHSGAHRH